MRSRKLEPLPVEEGVERYFKHLRMHMSSWELLD